MSANDPWEKFNQQRGPEVALTKSNGDIVVLSWNDILVKESRGPGKGTDLVIPQRVYSMNGGNQHRELRVKEDLAEIYDLAGVDMPKGLREKLEASKSARAADRRRPVTAP